MQKTPRKAPEPAPEHVPAFALKQIVVHDEHGKVEIRAQIMTGPYPVYMVKKPGRIDLIRAVATRLSDS